MVDDDYDELFGEIAEDFKAKGENVKQKLTDIKSNIQEEIGSTSAALEDLAEK